MSSLLFSVVLSFVLVDSIMWLPYLHHLFLLILEHAHTSVRCLILPIYLFIIKSPIIIIIIFIMGMIVVNVDVVVVVGGGGVGGGGGSGGGFYLFGHHQHQQKH